MVSKEVVIKDKVENKHMVMPTLDINKIVKKAQEYYGKNEKGLAKQLSTGDTIVRPSKDSDFVLWPNGDHWFKLTRLRGLPFGKITQISGKPDSGKSTHAAVFMASAQAAGYYVILWDAEQKFQNVRYDKQMGGNSKSLLIVDTNSIQEGARAVAFFVHAIKAEDKDAKILIVFDSVGAGMTKSENDEDETMSSQPMVQAKEVNWAIKKFNGLINKYRNKDNGEHTVAVLVINQVYANLMTAGFKEKGGDGLYYLCSLIVQLTRKKDLTRVKSGEKFKYGIVSRAKVKKNHLFDGEECLSEMEIVVGADGVQPADEIKKKAVDVEGWDQEDENNED